MNTTHSPIPVLTTSVYPTRYAAFDISLTLFVHDNPKKSGGHEWAVYNDYTTGGGLYAEIVSYQDKYLLARISLGQYRIGRGGVLHPSQMFEYADFERAKSWLLKQIEQASAPSPES